MQLFAKTCQQMPVSHLCHDSPQTLTRNTSTVRNYPYVHHKQKNPSTQSNLRERMSPFDRKKQGLTSRA